MNDYSKILWEAYEKFLLPLGGKLVPTPYRRNEYGLYQKVGPEFQGKSSPEVLIRTTKKLAKQQKFNLNKASVEQIKDFMRKNQLGIDCSGFAYRMLNSLAQEVKGQPLTVLGFEHVGRTGVVKLTSPEVSTKVNSFKEAKSGDLIRIDSAALDGILHCLVVLDNQKGTLTYAHSSKVGVHTDQIKNGKFPKDLKAFSYKKQAGDGIRRLKCL